MSIPVVFTLTVKFTSFVTFPAETYIVTFPFDIPFTSPVELTVAITGSDDLYKTVASVAFDGSTVADILIVLSTSISCS